LKTSGNQIEGFRKGVSVVVPVYNSEGMIRTLVERARAALDSIGREYELILVNDGSADGSWKKIREAAAEHGWITGINLMRNYGQHNALLCGVRKAQYSVTVTMDDDLQHPPEEIRKLIDKLDEGFDVVYGRPVVSKHSASRKLASRLIRLILRKATAERAASEASAFRAFRTVLRDAFEGYIGPSVSLDMLLTWGASKYAAEDVEHAPRLNGKSNYTFRKLLNHALDMLTGFSVWPLQIASMIGFSFTVFGVLVLAYVLIRYIISGGSIPGFPFLASIIAIFSGAQLFALGIIGEYISRVHFRTAGYPTYAISETAGGEDSLNQDER